MKSILYVGATLMIGASIYGFVDYKNTSQQKEFTEMYEEEKKIVPAVEDEVITPGKELVAIKQASSKEEIAVVNKETKEISSTSTEPKKSKPVVKKAKKKKKLDHRIFSRGPLRDEEINMPELVKPEEKKIEKKEQ